MKKNTTQNFSLWIFARFLRSMLLLIGASFLIYATLRLTPGDMVNQVLGIHATEEMRSVLRKDFGLDSSILVGYIQWCFKALGGDLGVSITFMPGEPVTELAAHSFWVTLQVTLLALCTSIILAFGLAWVLGPPKPQHAMILSPLSFLNAAPSFVIAICLYNIVNRLIQWFNNYLIETGADWLWTPSWYPIPINSEDSFVPMLLAVICIALGDGLFTDLFNTLRSELIQVQNAQFMNAIRAKGANPLPHLFKNLIVPTLSVFTARLPLVLSAVVVVEYIFTLSGSGYLLIQAAQKRDLPVLVGVSLFFILAVVISNLLLDVIKAKIDPREISSVE